MAVGDRPPLEVWAVSDGRAGIHNQVLGLAEAVARLSPARVIEKRVAYRGALGRLPAGLNLLPRLALSPDADRLGPPWPDLWIAAGRVTLPLSVRVKRWSAGHTFVVQVQDPRWPTRLFDLVVAPRHDRVRAENVVEITGSPNRVTPARLAEARAAFADRIEPLPSPRVAVLVGGRSKAFSLTPKRAAAICEHVAAMIQATGGSLLVTFSRRTPDAARAVLDAGLSALPGWVWNGEGPNPYFAFLAWADHVLVTEDSTNMAVEAASAGAPVHIVPLQGGARKFRLLHADLERIGAARPFDGRLEPRAYAPLQETHRAALAIIDRLERPAP